MRPWLNSHAEMTIATALPTAKETQVVLSRMFSFSPARMVFCIWSRVRV